MISTETISAAIGGAIDRYVQSSGSETMWKPPLTAFARADDPRFVQLKEAVSPSHLLPGDILAGAQTVICFFIPFTDGVIAGNEAGGDASREWALCYIRTNELIQRISSELDSLLAAEGYRCGLVPATHNFDEERLLSDWSHRHAALIAGLGSFGENNMLITEKGCCGRCGTLITDWQVPKPAAGAASRGSPPAQREYCLAKQGISCGLCRAKCPVNAYGDGPGGTFDRHACYRRCLHNAALYRDLGLADVCGKCLCGLPCSGRGM